MEETSKKVRHTSGMKSKKYLSLYNDWLSTGEIPYMSTGRSSGGLCCVFNRDRTFKFYFSQGALDYACFWGYGFRSRVSEYPKISTCFTPLRQNIVLLLAALNNEL